MQLEDERRIIEQAQTNPEAFGAIFDEYYQKLLSYVVHRTGNVMLAEEIVAETFAKALKNLPKFHWYGISIEAWLFRIAINELRMQFRRKVPTVSLDELYQQQGFEPQADYDLVQEALEVQERLERHQQFIYARQLIAALPDKYQDVLLLRFVQGKKVSEIAQMLNKKEGTVKSLLSRGLSRLRAELTARSAQPNNPPRIIKRGQDQ